MIYWMDQYVEVRDIYNGTFQSPITTPALKGNLLDNNGGVLGLYELEITRDHSEMVKRFDSVTESDVEDVCVMFEFRTTSADDRVGSSSVTSPLPLTELTDELRAILADESII